LLVRSELFKIHQIIGNPIHEVQRFNQWNVDELIYLDISKDDQYDLRRADAKVKNLSDPLQILEAVSKSCFMPLTWGGRIRTLEDMHARISRGADKITLNSQAVRTPNLISEGARVFGSQAIVVSIDARRQADGRPEVFIDGGAVATGLHPVDWARQCEAAGAGEILLQVINRDGTGEGYDVELIREMTAALSIPLIACSGVGRFEDYAAGIQAGASAVAAANLWHFKEMADRLGKKALLKAGINVRT
jgi:cyclase